MSTLHCFELAIGLCVLQRLCVCERKMDVFCGQMCMKSGANGVRS